MKQKLIKVGNSLMVVVPSSFTKKLNLKSKDMVEVNTDVGKAKMTIKFSAISQLTLDEKIFK